MCENITILVNLGGEVATNINSSHLPYSALYGMPLLVPKEIYNTNCVTDIENTSNKVETVALIIQIMYMKQQLFNIYE